ncbi:FAD-binding oxidoreductase [Hoeflea sp.]|uniref:FAD-binding oxidoreductase n=1 Tax=Hoeflea sp. TaxID=1940281 RepID=UPI002AFF98DF|nr:FAD-binding oxidoreductase [Hoeflea sp.]
MNYRMTLKRIEPVTHDTYHLVFDRPEGFQYSPGQGVDLYLLKPGWEDEGRPFTPVSLPHEPTLEFVIKSYPDHHGMTEQIGALKAGEDVLIKEPSARSPIRGRACSLPAGQGSHQ